MEYFCISDIGLIREKNQDSYLALENKYGDFLAIVADGIGGGKAGEVASSEVIKYFNEIFKESGPFSSSEDVKSFLEYHVNECNRKVFELSLSDKKYSGMGTTLTGVLITSKDNYSINCGDSRVYGFIDNKLIKLTNDHSLVNQLLEKGQITYEESINHPQKHYLVKAIGIFDYVKSDIHKVKSMDYYLVCSDGLHSYVSDEEISNIVLNDMSVEEKVIELKNLALLKGGYDNITIILIKK